jgi:hypothetical protein
MKGEKIMEVNLEHAVALLASTPAALDALLRGLSVHGRSPTKAKIPGVLSTLSAISFTASAPTGCPVQK